MCPNQPAKHRQRLTKAKAKVRSSTANIPANHDKDVSVSTKEDGHVQTRGPKCGESSHPPAKRGPGRPKGSKNDPNKPARPRKTPQERLAEDRASVILRQRLDCKRLAEAINACARQGDKGAGSSGLAAAVGQLSRATATLHDLETKAYGLQGDNRGQVAVIMVPAQALSIEAWAQGQQAAGLQTIGGPSPDDPHARASGQAPRLIEPDVDGEVPEDAPDGPQQGADEWDDL